jgi:NADH dehydrogenase
MMAMGLFFGFGPGPFSIDYLILSVLKRRYPQFSGKPAFNLENLPRVVIVGAGFGGMTCAKALRDVPVKISLIDRRNYHLFQPLLYQVATGGLSPADIAIPIRAIFKNQFNVEVLLGEVNAIDKENRILHTQNLQIPYDYLIIATGATHSYFGKDNWAPFAPGLKQIEDAISVRSKLVETFELAEMSADNNERKRLLTFVIIGGGPTGVELAGAIAELSRYGMEKNYRHFDPASAEIILIQSAPRILPTFSEIISKSAQQSLEKMGVKILLNNRVEQVDEDGVMVKGQKIYTKSVLWAAGVTASPAAKWLNVEADPAGRVKVNQDLSIPNYPNIFVIGDTASTISWNGKLAPGIAQAAKQAGKHVARIISQIIYNEPPTKDFKYKHLGMLATIGRKSAVAEFNYIKLRGAIAWWFWVFSDIFFLVGARNRSSVILNWAWSYFTYRANNLLITQRSFEVQKTFQEHDK